MQSNGKSFHLGRGWRRLNTGVYRGDPITNRRDANRQHANRRHDRNGRDGTSSRALNVGQIA